MRRFGFNINFRNTPEEILELGRAVLESELYHAIEVTYYENMAGVDVLAYDHAVRQIAQAYRPNVSVHISAFNASEENSVLRSAILHEFRNCCQYTSLLGGHEIVMHSGRLRTSLHVPQVPHSSAYMGGDLQRIWALSVEMLRNCCDIAKEYGIRLYTENLLDGDLTVRCGTLVQFINEVGRNNLDIVFDIGHCQQTGGNVPDEVLAGNFCVICIFTIRSAAHSRICQSVTVRLTIRRLPRRFARSVIRASICWSFAAARRKT